MMMSEEGVYAYSYNATVDNLHELSSYLKTILNYGNFLYNRTRDKDAIEAVEVEYNTYSYWLINSALNKTDLTADQMHEVKILFYELQWDIDGIIGNIILDKDPVSYIFDTNIDVNELLIQIHLIYSQLGIDSNGDLQKMYDLVELIDEYIRVSLINIYKEERSGRSQHITKNRPNELG